MRHRIGTPFRNRLILHRQASLAGPFFSATGPGVLAKSVGNFRAPGKPGSGPRAYAGIVLDENTVRISFSQCVTVNTAAACQIRLNGGAWENCTAAQDVLGSIVWSFTNAIAQTINPGDDVDWRYSSGSSGIVDCQDGEDIGDQQVEVENPLVLAGDFILLENGGMDILLLEDDPGDDSRGVQLENAT